MKKVFAITLVMVMTLLAACGSNNGNQAKNKKNDKGYEAVAEGFESAYQKHNYEKAISYLPEEAVEWIVKQSPSSTKEELIKNSKETDKMEQEDDKEAGIKLDEITCKAAGSSVVKKEELGGIFRGLDLPIEEARWVAVEVTKPNMEGMDEVVNVPVAVVKIDGKWYAYMNIGW